MIETVLRLVSCGVNAPDAWDACFDFWKRKDLDGLEAYIAEKENRSYLTADVIEEVLSQVGLESIQQ